jgi:two-component system OmpR family response regulator
MHTTADPHDLRVLVVDDDPKLAALLARGLSECGMQAEAVLSGEAALERVEGRRFDVIVLDVLLPGIDGVEVLRRLRERRCAAAIVFLTAHWDAAGSEFGADGIFPKPFSFDELAERVRELGAAA